MLKACVNGQCTDERRGGAVSPNDNAGNEFRDLNPFCNYAEKYRDAGWLGTLPLPYKKKEKPPDRIKGQKRKFTGGDCKYPTEDELKFWLGTHSPLNICIRLAGVDNDTEIVGIDADHYLKAGKQKFGGDQLQALENELGSLPDTWISSARVDGISGIRYYRVPRGLGFRGKAAKDIDVVSKGHKYAIVFPSIHPEEGLGSYWWFPPGVKPTLEGRQAWQPGMDLPDAQTLPKLPDKWIDYLTDLRRKFDPSPMDLESTVDELYQWATSVFDTSEVACAWTKRLMEKHTKEIKEHADSHDQIKDAHWSFVQSAFEGHTGIWKFGIEFLENYYKNDVWNTKDGKRGIQEAENEIFRSRVGALRKIKKVSDDNVVNGYGPLKIECDAGCRGELSDDDDWLKIRPVIVVPDGPLSDIPRGWCKQDISKYLRNDDGNAHHFHDKFPMVHWIRNYGWIVWRTKPIPHWEVDITGELVRQMWWKVRDSQVRWVEQEERRVSARLAAVPAGPRGGAGQPSPALKRAAEDVRLWREFARVSGNNRAADAALEACKKRHDIGMDFNQLDSKPELLGVSNGVVEISEDGISLRDADPEDYITLNTGQPYIPWSVLREGRHFYREGMRLLDDFLDRFIPEQDHRKNIFTVLGYAAIYGENVERLIIGIYGPTSSGKTTLTESMLSALGDYGTAASITVLQNHKLNPELVDTLPKRLAVIPELSSESNVPSERLKQLSGNEVVRGELKNQNQTVSRIPAFTLAFPTNDFADMITDAALRRRMLILDFSHTIDEEHDIQGMKAEIKKHCAVPMLSMLLEGVVNWKRGGIPRNDERIKKVTDQVMAEMDNVAWFANNYLERTIEDENLDFSDVFQKYRMYCESSKVLEKLRCDQRNLGKRLRGLNFQTKLVRPQGKEPRRQIIGVRYKNLPKVGKSLYDGE